jgi:predicted nucleic acid-binding protein
MTVAYVDTSCLVAVAFGEPRSDAVVRELEACDEIVSSNLLEAELLATLKRENVEDGAATLLRPINWVLPERRLTPEIERSLGVGQLRGADLWHVATALYLAESPGDVMFLTLDKPQREVAEALGFRTPL